jgi:anti-sigma regulatory factor (Ser/Thr protein kinase)
MSILEAPINNQSVLIERRWNCHPCNVHSAREITRNFVRQFDADQADLIELAIGEACANAVEHGAPEGPHSCFTLRCIAAMDPCQMIFEVEDEGTEFALTNISLGHIPDLEQEGGRGLFLINSIMDEVRLQSSSNGLLIRMVKQFSPVGTLA